MHLWILALLFAALLPAQTWVKGEIGFRLTVIPADCPADRAGLKLADILANPPGVRPALNGTGMLPVFRFAAAKASYARETVKIAFKENEERRLGVTGDLGFLITAMEPGSLAARAGLRVGDFLPQIDDSFVHDVKDLTLVDRAQAEGREAAIHVTRWLPAKQTFEKSVVRYK